MPEMLPKPKHLGPEYASQFADPAVVAAYHHRPPYAPALFPVLRDLVVGEPRTVLDLGCGTGDIARPLPHATYVDVVGRIIYGRPLGSQTSEVRTQTAHATDSASVVLRRLQIPQLLTSDFYDCKE